MLPIATGLGLPRRQLCISQRLRSRLGCRTPLRQMGAHAREVTSELRLCHGANIDGTHATRQQRPAVGYARHRGIPLTGVKVASLIATDGSVLVAVTPLATNLLLDRCLDFVRHRNSVQAKRELAKKGRRRSKALRRKELRL